MLTWVLDESKIAEYTTQIADLQSKIESLRAKQAARKANKQKRPKKSGSSKPRKQSLAKTSPGLANGNGKKARKPKDISYRDDEDDEEIILTTTQKTDLANKIQNADGVTLSKAVSIIQTAQDVAEVSLQTSLSGLEFEYGELTWKQDGEIELDIDSLPNAVIKELYLLVVGPIKKARKSAYVPTGKKPGRKPGGPRKSMNEAEEAERIARMQAQLQSFEGRAQPANGFAEDDSESSEEEDSDLE
jgi:bromodomain-containing factor 1